MEIQSITPELEEKGLRLDKVILNHMRRSKNCANNLEA